MRGSTASDDEVPTVIRISSLMYFRNFKMLNPVIRQMRPSTTKTKNAHVR